MARRLRVTAPDSDTELLRPAKWSLYTHLASVPLTLLVKKLATLLHRPTKRVQESADEEFISVSGRKGSMANEVTNASSLFP